MSYFSLLPNDVLRYELRPRLDQSDYLILVLGDAYLFQQFITKPKKLIHDVFHVTTDYAKLYRHYNNLFKSSAIAFALAGSHPKNPEQYDKFLGRIVNGVEGVKNNKSVKNAGSVGGIGGVAAATSTATSATTSASIMDIINKAATTGDGNPLRLLRYDSCAYKFETSFAHLWTTDTKFPMLSTIYHDLISNLDISRCRRIYGGTDYNSGIDNCTIPIKSMLSTLLTIQLDNSENTNIDSRFIQYRQKIVQYDAITLFIKTMRDNIPAAAYGGVEPCVFYLWTMRNAEKYNSSVIYAYAMRELRHTDPSTLLQNISIGLSANESGKLLADIITFFPTTLHIRLLKKIEADFGKHSTLYKCIVKHLAK